MPQKMPQNANPFDMEVRRTLRNYNNPNKTALRK
jgi:hypothetical protein